jgi:hypothetical protein
MIWIGATTNDELWRLSIKLLKQILNHLGGYKRWTSASDRTGTTKKSKESESKEFLSKFKSKFKDKFRDSR